MCGWTHREDAVKRRALWLQVSVHDPSARRRVTHLGSPGGRGKGRSGGGEEWRRKSTRSNNVSPFHTSSESKSSAVTVCPVFLSVSMQIQKQDLSAGEIFPPVLSVTPPSDPNPSFSPFVFVGLSKQSWEPVRPGQTEATAEDKHFTSRILVLYKEL